MGLTQKQDKHIGPSKTLPQAGKVIMNHIKKCLSCKHTLPNLLIDPHEPYPHTSYVEQSNDKRSIISNPDSNTNKQIDLRKPEEENKYMIQAKKMIIFTIQEAKDLERLLKMSDRLSSDTKYVLEVMSRLLIQLNKIETGNNKKIIEQKTQGRLYIKQRIIDMLQYSKKIKRMIKTTEFGEPTNLHSKCINTEQVKRRKMTREESTQEVALTTLKEGSEKADATDEETINYDKNNHSEDNSNFEVNQTFIPTPYILNPNANVKFVPSSSLYAGLDPAQNNFKIRKIIGPYIIINQEVPTLLENSTIQNETINETQKVTEKIENDKSVFFPGLSLELRLVIVLILSLLVEIPILLIMSPLW